MTAQIHETLIIDGKKSSMAFCPPLPENDPRLTKLKDSEIKHGIILSTACWRQYIGTWEIKDDQLYLVSIEGRFKLSGDSPILADWFTGTLRIPQGKVLHYVHMGYGSVFEQELHIKIENGKVIKSNTIDNRNKDIDTYDLGWKNLPGSENKFDGDDL